jgi:hypothetical protein
MKKRIEKEFNSLKEKSVVLTILPKDGFEKLNFHILKTILNQGVSGAYVSVNRPYDNLICVMKKNKVDHENLLFIDCVSASGEQEKCTFLGGSESLTNIGIALEPVYKSADHSFIFLDSLDGLSLYHKPEVIIRFARSLIDRIRKSNMHGVMIGLHEDTDKKIIDELSIVSDNVLDLTK